MISEIGIQHLYQDRNCSGQILNTDEKSVFEEVVVDGEIVGYYNVRLKKLKMLPFYTMRLTFGPVIDYKELETLDLTLKQIKATAQKYGVINIQVHPFIWNVDLEAIRKIFKDNGFERIDYYIYEATMLIDLKQSEDEIFKKFENRGKEAIRQSERRGITAKQVELNEENLASFYKLYSDTCKRTLIIPEALSIIKAIIKMYEHTYKVLLFIAFYEERPVCSFVAFDCYSCLSLIYQGSEYANDIPKRRPANGLYWFTIKWAKENGYKWFDLAGVNANPMPGSKSEGIRLYKRQFGGLYVEFPGNFEFVNRPFLKFIITKILPMYSKIVMRREKRKHYNVE